MSWKKRGPEADARKEIYYRLIRRFGFERVMRHVEAIKRAIP